MYVACNMALLSITRLHLQTLWEIEMASASSTLNTLAVNPSPRSLASQHLQANIYLTPLVGTATHSSSTSQQLSGVAPSWPSCRKERNNHCQERGCIFFCVFQCVCVWEAMLVHNLQWNKFTCHSPQPFWSPPHLNRGTRSSPESRPQSPSSRLAGPTTTYLSGCD